MLLNCGIGEDSWQSHGLQGDPTSKGNQSWIFIERTGAEVETPVLWPHDKKSWLIWKELDAGKVWGPEEKGATEDEMFGCYHWLNGHGSMWIPGVGDGQGGMACCDSWFCRVGHDRVTELILMCTIIWVENAKVKVLVTQSYLTLDHHMDCSPPGSSDHEILQARLLECVAIPFSRVSSWPRNWTHVSCISGRFFTIWATREAQTLLRSLQKI